MAKFGKRRQSNDDDDSILLKGIQFLDAQYDGEIPLDEIDEFIIPGADQKGRSVTITFNIPPELDRQLDVVMCSRRFPYVNKKDLIRHAVARHVGWLINEIRKNIPREKFWFFRSIVEAIRDDEALMKMEQVFQILSSRAQEHMNRGEQQELIKLVSHINQSILQMPDSLWVRRFKERFYPVYGSVLKGTYRPSIDVEVVKQLESGD